MQVTTLVLNEAGDPHFRAEDQIDLGHFFEMAATREQKVRDMGAEKAAGAIPFWGSEVVKAVNIGENDDVTKAIYPMVMAAWLYDSIFCGVKDAQYRESSLEFTIWANGTVQHRRIAATTPA